MQPLKDWDRGRYTHFLDHNRATRTPRVKCEKERERENVYGCTSASVFAIMYCPIELPSKVSRFPVFISA